MAVGPAELRLSEIYTEYQRRLQEASAVDFDDLLVLAVRLFREHPEALDRYRRRFQHVLVDEFQDTNAAQWELVRLLTAEHHSVMVVGDLDQCLVAGTAITMGDRTTKPIEDVRVGDEVLSCYGSGDFRPAPVLRVHPARAFAGVSLTLASGRQLTSTPEHMHFAGYVGADDARAGSSGSLSVVLCSDQPGATPTHRISMVGDDERDRLALAAVGLSAKTRGGSDGWAFETGSADMGVIADTVERITGALDVRVRYSARLARNDGLPTANSLPFMPAASIRPGMVMVDESGEFDVVTAVEWVKIDEPVYDIDVDRTHNFVANGIVTHNSIYKFRGADFRNLMKFEESFPEAVTVVLDQNYRSTQRILDAANAVIENNASHRPKQLWTDKGTGEPIVRFQGDDEHDEAAFVVREIHRLIDGADHRYGDVAVFYRTNAQSRVLEESLVRSGVPYRVFGGVKFYDRREIKDALAYFARAGESRRRSVVEAHREHAPARCRRHVGREDRLVRERRGYPVPGRDREGATTRV